MKKDKKISLNVVITLIIVSIFMTFATTYFVINMLYYNKYKEYKLLGEAEAYVNNFFYKDDVDKENLIDGAVGGYIGGLQDKYSRYQNLESTNQNSESQMGVHTGIGISVTLADDGYINIEEVSENSPSSKAGLKVGDIIVCVNGNDVAKTGYEQSVMAIQDGAPDSELTLGIKRGEVTSDFTLKREKIEIITVEGELLDNSVAHISISKFNEKTPEQLSEKMKELIDDGAKGIIFDLRNNGGGLVSSVEKCLDPLLPEGDIAVAIYKNGDKDTIIKSDAEETDISMVILINENSASGAELFSASLRDFKNVDLIGQNSYGKGVMQDTFKLSDGSTIVLTVARYKTTKSECYNGIGLAPDYEVKDDDQTSTDEQLDKALKVIKGKIN